MCEKCVELKEENRKLKSLLGRIHKATHQFYEPKDDKPDSCPYDTIMDMYHRILTGLPKVRKLGNGRKKSMRQRWQNDLITLADWESYFHDAASKPFLFGQNDRAWVATIDFLLREDAVIKMQEGVYDDRA